MTTRLQVPPANAHETLILGSLWMVAMSAAAVILAATSAGTAEGVVIDTSKTYQTIHSWGAPSGVRDSPDALLDPLLDELVYSLGLTRTRLERFRRKREDPLNDDGDPFHVNPAAFNMAGTDDRVTRFHLPFKRRVESLGDRYEFYVSPSFFNGGSTGGTPAWLLNSPGEYAEWALQVLQYLRSRYNLRADYYCICNEAGNDNDFSTPVVAAMIKALAPRLESLGFRTRIQFPESVSANTAWTAIQSVQGDAELWRWVGLVSYHLYGRNTSRTNIRDFAWSRSLPTAQTEYIRLNIGWLHDDLTQGGVSSWEWYAINDFIPLSPDQTWFSRNANFWQTRQVTKFVRPGATRVDATSTTDALRPLAFLQNGRTVLVLLNNTDRQARIADVSGLTPGVYARSQTTGGIAQELGLVTVPGSGVLSVSLPASAVFTLYPHPGTNLPPNVTDWKATPAYLKQPASSARLSSSGSDPEQGALAYSWSLLSAPAGAQLRFDSPNSASCVTTGLTVAGNYLFELRISDGTNAITRRLPLTVHAGNQPPEIIDLHNRHPVTLFAPTNTTSLRCGGRDLEQDPLTYQWSVVSQPAGAAALLLAPKSNNCPVTNLNVAGDYVFRITMQDPTHSVFKDHTVTVHPANRPPAIVSANASPAGLTLPASSTTLSCVTSDPDGDVRSHWWSVSNAPAGALPVIANPGATNTAVSGLILPGPYTFRLVLVDRAAVAVRNVTVSVTGGGGARLFLASPNGGETYTAMQTIHLRWASDRVAGNVRLEFFDGTAWQTIAKSISNDGAETWTLPHGNFAGCKLRVVDVATGTVSDESDGIFTITAETPRVPEHGFNVGPCESRAGSNWPECGTTSTRASSIEGGGD